MASRKLKTLFPALFALSLLTGCESDPEKPDKPDDPEGDGPKVEAREFDWNTFLDAQPVEKNDGATSLLTGSPGGGYYETARGIAKVGGENGVGMSLVTTNGSQETLYMLAWGYGDLGMIQGDVLADPRNRTVAQSVEVVSRLMTEEVHVMLPKGSKVKSLADLDGQRVAVGPPGSGSAITAQHIMEAAGHYGVLWDYSSVSLAFQKLSTDDVSAVILVGGRPLRALIKEERFKLLDLDAEVDDVLGNLGGAGVYTRAKLEYPKLGKVSTIGVAAFLVARKDLDNLSAVKGLKLKGAEAILACHPKGAQVGEGEAGFEASKALSVHYRDPKLPIRVAAGSRSGTYYKVARGIRRMLESDDNKQVEVYETAGSLQNFLLVATGQAEVGIVQEDLIQEALRSPRTAPLIARVRLISPLFREELHLVTNGAKLGSFKDLKGKRFGIGQPGSGNQITAHRLMRLNRIAGQVNAVALDSVETLALLESGDIDAALFVGGQPLGTLSQADVKFVSLNDQKGYLDTKLVEGMYPGQSNNIPTVSTRALLICRFDMDDEVATSLTQTLFKNRGNLTRMHAKCKEIDPGSIAEERTGLKVHDGVTNAVEVGLEVDGAKMWTDVKRHQPKKSSDEEDAEDEEEEEGEGG